MSGAKGQVHKNPGGRRRGWRQDPAGRRMRVLDAAECEFAERGFREARMDRVAAAANVAEGTVYHQFGSKQGLLVAVGERYGAGLAAAAFGDPGPSASLVEEIETIVRAIFAYVRETDGSLMAFLLALDPLEGGPAQDANRAQVIAALEGRLQRRVERGLIDRPNLRVTAEVQFGLVESALRGCFLRHGGADEVAYLREVIDCLTAYLSSAPSSPLTRDGLGCDEGRRPG